MLSGGNTGAERGVQDHYAGASGDAHMFDGLGSLRNLSGRCVRPCMP